MAGPVSQSLHLPIGPYTEAWQEIDGLLDEMANLARSPVEVPAFYGALLDGLLRALKADGGAVWQIVPAMPVARVAQAGAAPAISDEMVRWVEGWRLAGEIAESCLVLPPHSTSARSAVPNPSNRPLILRPVQCEESATYLLAVALDAAAPRAADSAAAQVLNLFCETAAEFHQRRELQERRRLHTNLREFDQLVARLHANLDLDKTAYALANDGRLWIGCDRLSVGLIHGQSVRVRAISGSDQVDRRSQQVGSLEDLLAAVAASGEPLHWPGESKGGELPPQLDTPLQAYLDLAHARRLIVAPLRAQAAAESRQDAGPPIGVLLAETFDDVQSTERLRQRVDDVVRHGGAALANSIAFHELPLRPLQAGMAQLLRSLRRRPVPALMAAVCAAAVAAALAFIPAEFSVPALGTLQPEGRRHLFAPASGVVERVAVAHGQRVAPGDELLRIRDPELDLDYSRTSGELQTHQARLASIRARRSTRSTATDPQQEDRQLAAEEEQLKQQLSSLAAQLELLERRHAELVVTSPITGIVLTWNPEELLRDRPVREGQMLMTVADPAGPWILELRVPDTDIGPLLAAQRQGPSELPVTFLLETEPAATYRGRIAKVAEASDSAGGASPSVLVTVQLESQTPASARAGAGVVARIHCGPKSIGYVWLHDLIDAVRTQLLF